MIKKLVLQVTDLNLVKVFSTLIHLSQLQLNQQLSNIRSPSEMHEIRFYVMWVWATLPWTSHLAEPAAFPPLAVHSKLRLPEPPESKVKGWSNHVYFSVCLCMCVSVRARDREVTCAKLLIPTVPIPSSPTRIHSCLSVNLSAARKHNRIRTQLNSHHKSLEYFCTAEENKQDTQQRRQLSCPFLELTLPSSLATETFS